MKTKFHNKNGKSDMILSVQNIFQDSTQFYILLNLTRSMNYLQLCTPYDEKPQIILCSYECNHIYKVFTSMQHPEMQKHKFYFEIEFT